MPARSTLDGYGTLTISGTGAMADYATTADCPWNNAGIISKVTRVIVEDGVTTLSNNGFTGFTNVADVIFNGDVLSVWPSHTTDFANSTVCYVNYSCTGRYTDALATFHFDCGSGLDWTLSGGILAISKTKEGTGTFYNYQNANEVPWRNDVGNITATHLRPCLRRLADDRVHRTRQRDNDRCIRLCQFGTDCFCHAFVHDRDS